jgi:hypothetical protein
LQVSGLGAVSLLILTGVVAIWLLVPSAAAPRVNVRWVAGLPDATRAGLEHRFALLAGKHHEGSTWTYDLGDPSSQNIRALIDHEAVEDTHYIDRPRAVVAGDAPRGTTVIARSRLDAWRESIVLEWVAIFCFCAATVSAVWLASTGRAARRSAGSTR